MILLSVIVNLLAIVFGVGVGLTVYELLRGVTTYAGTIGTVTGLGAFGLSLSVATAGMLLADILTVLRNRDT